VVVIVVRKFRAFCETRVIDHKTFQISVCGSFGASSEINLSVAFNVDWAKFDEVPMEVAPEITQPLPWMNASLPNNTDLVADDWASFDVAQPESTKLSSADDGWADFAAFSDAPAQGSK